MRFVPHAITRSVGRQILATKKNSPHIAFGVGLIGVVGGAVLACRATLKLSETLDEIKHEVDDVKGMTRQTDGAFEGEYDHEAYQRDLAFVYGKSILKVGRLYAPSVVVGAVSIGALTGSHVSLTRRNAALTAAFTAISAAYNEYRQRIIEEVGPERELEIYRAASSEVIKVEGKKQVVAIADPNKHSPYARFFDEGSPHWTKDPEVNRLWVQAQQNWLNNLLQARGHVFLNEAYDSLGIDRSTAGAVVGWVLDGEGDSYIDFGIFEASERGRAFVNGWERTILLDFNVDGVIYDKI